MPGTADKRTAARRPSPASIDRERQHCLALINRARLLGEDGNALLDKASSLLTAHWGHATWSGRAAILKTVDWLLRVAINNPSPPPSGRTRAAAAGQAQTRRAHPITVS